jgi:hypothetical protein
LKLISNSHSEVSVADVCFTAITGDRILSHRLAVVVDYEMQLPQLQTEQLVLSLLRMNSRTVSEKVKQKAPK